MKLFTRQFTFSKQAKKLPKTILINEELAYILGLWKADRCSTAKGIVGLRSKDTRLLETFKKFLKSLNLQEKERTVIGYGKTKEVYVCSMPLRRIFEFLSKNRANLLNRKELIAAYISGLIDGDGTIIEDKGKRIIRIFYDRKDKNEAEIDKKLLERVNVKSKLRESTTRNLCVLTIRDVSSISKLILPFLLLKRKKEKLLPLA